MLLSFQTVQLSPRFGVAPALDAVLDAAAAAGWTHVGLDLPSIDAFENNGGSVDGLAASIAARGLGCTDILPVILSEDAGEVMRNAARVARLAGLTGATVCGAAFMDDGGDPADPSVVDTVRRCADVLSAAGVRLAVEFLPYSPLRELEQAMALCDAIGFAQVGLMLDSWHVLVTGQLAGVADLPGEAIAVVQVSDAIRVGDPPRPVGDDIVDASRNHRQLPGDGNLDLEGFAAAVRSTGYDGVISPEVLSRDARAGTPHAFAVNLLRATTQFWPPAVGA